MTVNDVISFFWRFLGNGKKFFALCSETFSEYFKLKSENLKQLQSLF